MAVIEDGDDGDGPGTRKRRRVGEDGKDEDEEGGEEEGGGNGKQKEEAKAQSKWGDGNTDSKKVGGDFQTFTWLRVSAPPAHHSWQSHARDQSANQQNQPCKLH